MKVYLLQYIFGEHVRELGIFPTKQKAEKGIVELCNDSPHLYCKDNLDISEWTLNQVDDKFN